MVVGTTYRGLGEDGHYEIDVRVRNCSEAQRENRSYELSLEDIEGTRFQMVVWESSDQGTNCDWEEGSWYRLDGVTANVWPSGTVPHGTSSLEVEYIGRQRNDRQADILYLTDSHLGKTSHSYGGSSWSVSPEDGFKLAIQRAASKDLDAVVHGGDIFHHSGDKIGTEAITTCREGLVTLAKSGIPFYFIYGNHERKAGRRVMDRFIDDNLAEHLGPRYEVVGDAVAVYGVDHQSDWADFVPDFEPISDDMRVVLLIHQSVSPLTESTNPDCSLHTIQQEVHVPVDLIVTGHVHTRVEQQLEKAHGLSGGATARVGGSRTDLQPSVELISTDGGELNVQREFL